MVKDSHFRFNWKTNKEI